MEGMNVFQTRARPVPRPVVALVLAAAAMAIAGCGEDGATSAGTASRATTASWQSASPRWQRIVHDRGRLEPLAPTVALNGPIGNAYRCDRLVFYYSIARPARHLRAWVSGRPVRGMRGAPIVGDGGRRNRASGLAWSGHVQPAGLTEPGGPIEIHSRRPNYWAGVPPVTARVRVVVELKDGRTVSEVFPYIRLAPGFG